MRATSVALYGGALVCVAGIVILWMTEEPVLGARLVAREISVAPTSRGAGIASAPRPDFLSVDFDGELLATARTLRIDGKPPEGWDAPEVGTGPLRLSLQFPDNRNCGELVLSAATESADTDQLTIARTAPETVESNCDWAAVLSRVSGGTKSQPLKSTSRIVVGYDHSASKAGARILSRLDARAVSSQSLVEDVRPMDIGEEKSGDACLGDTIRMEADPLHIGRVEFLPAQGERRRPVFVVRTYATSYTKVDSAYVSCLTRHSGRRLLRLLALIGAAISAVGALLGLLDRRKCAKAEPSG